MAMAGEGAVAIWHDIAPEGRDNFYAWHGGEHMPERLGIPGFLRGRRFVAVDADLEFFNLYETRAVDVVKGDDYRARLNSPTPWTLRSVQSFRSVARSLCRVAASHGGAQGGIVATLRYDVADGNAARHQAAMIGGIIPALAARPGFAAAHLLVADEAASGEVNAEQRARGAANLVPRYVLMTEGWSDEAAFMETVRHELAGEKLAALGATAPFNLGFYRCQITIENRG